MVNLEDIDPGIEQSEDSVPAEIESIHTYIQT